MKLWEKWERQKKIKSIWEGIGLEEQEVEEAYETENKKNPAECEKNMKEKLDILRIIYTGLNVDTSSGSSTSNVFNPLYSTFLSTCLHHLLL